MKSNTSKLSPKITLFTRENVIIDFTNYFAELSYKDSHTSVHKHSSSFLEKMKSEDSDVIIIDYIYFKSLQTINIFPDNYAGDWLIVNVPEECEYPSYYWIDIGFSGMLYHCSTVDDLFRAIRAIYEKGQFWFSRNDLAKALRSYMKVGVSNHQLSERIAVNYSLTPKETDICCLMLSGLTNSQIANQKNISIYTVKNHVSKVMSKLNIASRKDLLEKKFCDF